MKKQMQSLISILLCLVMSIGLSSCTANQGAQPKTSPSVSPSAAPSVSPSASPATPAEVREPSLPIVNTPIQLTWFVPLYNANIIQSANEQYCWQEIQARTGIKIEFIHPPVGSEADTFNVRIASNDLPDIITWPWINFTGGPTKALNDGVIIDLKEYMDEYAPSYSGLIEEIPMAKANVTLDNGSVYGFIHAVPDPIINATGGFIIRKDWLDNVGLQVPETIDDWHTVLTAFKEKDPNKNGLNDEIPFISDKGGSFTNFAPAWGVRNVYFPDPALDGKIAYGPVLPEYKSFLETMAAWYAEGLIDPEFPTNVRKNLDEKITLGTVGSFYGAIGSQLGSYNINGAKDNSGFNLIGINHPKSKDGETYSTSDSILQGIGTQSSAVTTKNKHVIESIRLLDYLYSEEGRTLLNWGKEGESYVIENGKPKYTDLVMNNPNGLAKLDVIAKYAIPIYGYFSSFYLDSYSSINLSAQQQKDAAAIWAAQDISLCMPVLYPNAEEGSIINKKGADITTYTNEMLLKFVIGKESLDNFDAYVNSIKQMGIEELIEIYQNMYDRNQAKNSGTK